MSSNKAIKQAELHSFSPQIAEIVGINAAAVYHNIQYWVNFNARKKSKNHFHQGKYWTFNSVKAFSDQFSYLTPNQVRRALERLIQANLILEGNFHRNRSNRSKWYTLTNHLEEMPNDHLAKTPDVYTDRKHKEQIENKYVFSDENSVKFFKERGEDLTLESMSPEHYTSLQEAYLRHDPTGNPKLFIDWLISSGKELRLSRYNKWIGISGLTENYLKEKNAPPNFPGVEWKESDWALVESTVIRLLGKYKDRLAGYEPDSCSHEITTMLFHEQDWIIEISPPKGRTVRLEWVEKLLNEYLDRIFPDCDELVADLPIHIEFVIRRLKGSIEDKKSYLKRYREGNAPEDIKESLIRLHAAILDRSPYSYLELRSFATDEKHDEWMSSKSPRKQWYDDEFIRRKMHGLDK